MTDDSLAPIAIVGNLNIDQVIETVDRWPAWDEELLVESSRLDLAGTAGYLALAAHGLGIEPFVVSTIGDDANADFIRKSMRKSGIDDSGLVTIEGTQTSLGLIFVGPHGQRAILTVLGAHTEMDVDLARSQHERVAGCREVFLCGNYLLPKFGPGAVRPYASDLQAAGKLIVFDPSWDPADWPVETQAEVLELLEHVDLFMPNEPELCHMTRTSNWRDGIAALGERCQHVVIKRGVDGAVVVRNGTVTEHQGYSVHARNTIGAGDVFDMGYLYGSRQGWSEARTLEFACALAALVVSQEGLRRYPSVSDVHAFIATQLDGR